MLSCPSWYHGNICPTKYICVLMYIAEHDKTSPFTVTNERSFFRQPPPQQPQPELWRTADGGRENVLRAYSYTAVLAIRGCITTCYICLASEGARQGRAPDGNDNVDHIETKHGRNSNQKSSKCSTHYTRTYSYNSIVIGTTAAVSGYCRKGKGTTSSIRKELSGRGCVKS